MGSTFSSYEIARSGMYVSQRGLFVTGHNISNVNTPGYVRQQAIIQESKPVNAGKHYVGIGADIQETRQIRNQFLDNMYRNENQQLGYWEATSKTIDEIQTILGEPFGHGINQDIDQFFQSWSELSKNPSGLTERAIVRQRSISLVNTINHIGKQIDKIQHDINSEIKLKTNEINLIADRIANLNISITKSEAVGNNANDFRDERNLLIDQLSKYIKSDITEVSNGAVNISLGGVYLVNNAQTSKIKADYNAPNSSFYTVKWERNNQEIPLTDGMLKGLIDARGDVICYKGSSENGSPIENGTIEEDMFSDNFIFNPEPKSYIPELRKGLNILVNVMARKVNDIHSAGIGIDGSTGVDFFIKIDEDLPFEMGNIAINTEFDGENGLNKIAASATGTLPGDNTNAQNIVNMRKGDFYRTGNITVDIDGFYNSIITWFSAAGQESMRSADNQKKLALEIQNKKETISGVSMDEEMTFMMKYQHGYNASARVINVIDEMIEMVINRMGIVGR